MKVSVITATTGNARLADCIESVRNQTYKNIEHVVVVDGRSRWESVSEILDALEFPNGSNEHVIVLPHPTGLNRFNGHRIYGGFSFLASGDYIAWLDDDNEFTPSHIESLVRITEEKNLDWAYSLRQIVDSEGKFICNDDCENLGKYKSVINDHFVDVSCFFVRRELDNLIRFPLPLAHVIGQELGARGLQIFKGGDNVTFISIARPRALDRQATPVSETLAAILDYLESNPRVPRAEQWKALLALPQLGPDGDAAAREQTLLKELFWLLHQGHVIDYASKGLEIARKAPAREKPAPPAATSEADKTLG